MGDILTLKLKTKVQKKSNEDITIPMETFKGMQFKLMDLGNENALLKRRIRELEGEV